MYELVNAGISQYLQIERKPSCVYLSFLQVMGPGGVREETYNSRDDEESDIYQYQ